MLKRKVLLSFYLSVNCLFLFCKEIVRTPSGVWIQPSSVCAYNISSSHYMEDGTRIFHVRESEKGGQKRIPQEIIHGVLSFNSYVSSCDRYFHFFIRGNLRRFSIPKHTSNSEFSYLIFSTKMYQNCSLFRLNLQISTIAQKFHSKI